MRKFLKENWLKIIIVIAIVIIAIVIFPNAKKDTYKGFYYPDGCLVCDNYIESSVLNSAEDCVSWGERLKAARGNPADKWECGKNCEWKDGFSMCEDTFGEEGTGEHF